MRYKKYFGTDGIRGKVGKFPIIPDFILKLGWATGKVLSRYGMCKVVLGKDTRVSSHVLESALGTGLSFSGIIPMLTGPIPTPAIAYFTRVLRSVGGVVISASHNPFYDNGVKFFSFLGVKLSFEMEKAIELELENSGIMDCVQFRTFKKFSYIPDAADRYIEFCKGMFPSYLNLKGLKIIVDCGNGSAYHIAPYVLCDLGATIICVGCHPDGVNINKGCGSTDVRWLQSLVLKEHADLGIAYDGDADRVIMVDHLGNKVDGDQILYIIARDRKRNSQFLGGVIGTQMSNIGLEFALKTLGIPFLRSYVGDRFVLSMMRKRGWYLGGEKSGHIIFLDKTTTGDGIVTCLQVLLIMVNNQISLYDLCNEMYLFPQVLVNVPFLLCSKNPLTSDLIKNTLNEVKSELGEVSRILIRLSGTEPCIRVMVEGECCNRVTYCAKKIVDVLKTFE